MKCTFSLYDVNFTGVTSSRAIVNNVKHIPLSLSSLHGQHKEVVQVFMQGYSTWWLTRWPKFCHWLCLFWISICSPHSALLGCRNAVFNSMLISMFYWRQCWCETVVLLSMSFQIGKPSILGHIAMQQWQLQTWVMYDPSFGCLAIAKASLALQEVINKQDLFKVMKSKTSEWRCSACLIAHA